MRSSSIQMTTTSMWRLNVPRSPRVANKRALQYQLKVLANVSEKVAEVAQTYSGGTYPKYDAAFQSIFTMLDIAKDLLKKTEAMI